MSGLLFAGAVFLAFVVEMTTGFGASVVTVTLASQFLPIDVVLATFVPVNLLLSGYIVVRHHDAVAWRLLGRKVFPFMGAGFAAGLALFQLREQGWLKIAFASFVVLLAAAQLLARGRRAPRPLPLWPGGLALVVAGVIHGLFTCGGPLAVFVIGRELPDKRVFRSTLAVLWIVFHLILIPTYALAGTLNLATLRGSVWLLGALVLGTVAGEWLHHRIAEDRFRIAVNVVLLVAGLALLVRSI